MGLFSSVTKAIGGVTKSIGGVVGLAAPIVGGVVGGIYGGPAGASLGAGAGQLLGGMLTSQSQKETGADTAKILRETAEQQFGMSTDAIRTKFQLEKKSRALEATQDALFTRLKKVQIRQQAAIAVARRTSTQQVIRTSGVRGSFTRIRSGASEIQTAVQRQVKQLTIERTAREEQRGLELFASQEQQRLSLTQAEVTKQAGISGAVGVAAAASSAADIGLIQTAGGISSSLIQNPAVTSAISDFFSADKTTGILGPTPAGMFFGGGR